MKQTLPRISPRSVYYPWELNDETRRIGKAGVARARAALAAGVSETQSGQQVLPLRYDRPARRPTTLAA